MKSNEACINAFSQGNESDQATALDEKPWIKILEKEYLQSMEASVTTNSKTLTRRSGRNDSGMRPLTKISAISPQDLT
jgi:hypothetical protein